LVVTGKAALPLLPRLPWKRLRPPKPLLRLPKRLRKPLRLRNRPRLSKPDGTLQGKGRCRKAPAFFCVGGAWMPMMP
jgi:hypothetical protein